MQREPEPIFDREYGTALILIIVVPLMATFFGLL